MSAGSKAFAGPIAISVGGKEKPLATVAEAVAALSDAGWPVRGPRHRDALETCLKVEDGHRSTADARRAVVEAASEAGILLDG